MGASKDNVVCVCVCVCARARYAFAILRYVPAFESLPKTPGTTEPAAAAGMKMNRGPLTIPQYQTRNFFHFRSGCNAMHVSRAHDLQQWPVVLRYEPVKKTASAVRRARFPVERGTVHELW